MPVPKRRHTRSRRNQRRVHLKLKPLNFSFCPKCKTPIISHRVCPNCGYYRDKKVIDVLAKLEKKERKKKEKELKKAEKRERPLSLEELSKKKI